MLNFLFEDLENGGCFFVQCADETKIAPILEENDIDPESVVLLDVYDDYEAELLGYDTY